MFSSIVGTLGATSEDDVDILVTGGLNDGSEAILGDTHEGVGVGSGLHGIDGDTDTSVGPYVRECQRDERGAYTGVRAHRS